MRLSEEEYRRLLERRSRAERDWDATPVPVVFWDAEEAEIQEAIRSYLRERGIPHSKTDASRVWGPDGEERESKVDKGWPDLSGTLPPTGRSFYIEVKSKSGRVERHQKAKHDELRAAGALVWVARSVEDVVNFLKEVGDGRQAGEG